MKQIELLLLDNVANLGVVGDVVKVQPGYARNYLLPFGFAAKPSGAAGNRPPSRPARANRTLPGHHLPTPPTPGEDHYKALLEKVGLTPLELST